MFSLLILQVVLAQGAQVPIILVSKEVGVGQRLSADALVQRELPAFWAGRTFVHAEDASMAVNQIVAEPLAEGDLLSWGVFLAAMSSEECTAWRPGVPEAHALPSARTDGGPTKYVIAARDIPQGKVLNADDLSESGMPGYVGTRSLVPASARELLIGERALVRFDRGDMLRPAALSAFASPERCRLWRQEYGNVFDERGAPAEAARLACPRGTTARSAKVTPVLPEALLTSPGWVFRCETPTGVTNGPLMSWSRRGAPYERSSFKDGLRDGPTVLTTDQSTLTLEFVNGVVRQAPHGEAQMLVAGKDLLAGTTLDPTLLRRSVGPDLLALWVVTPDQLKVAVGRTLAVTVKSGSPVFFSDLR